MPIDFHAEQNRYTYATREADPSWIHTITSIINPTGKRVIDVGCGGGIYSQTWLQLGAAQVIGIDFSTQMVGVATERLGSVANLSFLQGEVTATGLRGGCADILFARALLHHITDLSACLNEAYRLLAPQGVCIIQDRTPDDVQIEG
jgi:ubiquinone/menaquinone biosynthesis C-methylase UbiE